MPATAPTGAAAAEPMKAVAIDRFGAPEVLRVVARAVPVAGAGEVLVRVCAAGVSRPDILQRRGLYPPPPGCTDIPGLELAGEIVHCGPGVSDWAIGQRVMALVAGGGYAQYCTVPQSQLLPLPTGWSYVEGATLPENLYTVWENLVRRPRLDATKSVMVLGGSGGIGTMAIMVAQLVGATVYATAGSDERCRRCETLGARRAYNRRTTDIVAALLADTDGRGVDAVLDTVGGDYVDKAIEMLAREGCVVLVGVASADQTDAAITRFSTLNLLRKRGWVTGTTLRNRTPSEKGEITALLRRHVEPALAARKPLAPLLDSVFRADQAAEAHRRLESGENFGKVVIDFDAG